MSRTGLAVIAEVADGAVVMDQGRIGEAAAAFHDSQAEYARAFVAAPACPAPHLRGPVGS
jgi:ABC-type dipeptide/oligopeptide/nickel transport system ATPase component